MFKLEFNIPESTKKISLSDPIYLIGSCFSDQIGKHLTDDKFNSLSNPFGTIYNPHSLFKLLTDQVSSEHIVESQGVFYHWDAHGLISGLSKEEVIQLMNLKRKETQAFLANAKWLILTLGTAHVYELPNENIVANCHKVPSLKFKKRLLSKKEIYDQFKGLHSYLTKINPYLNILFTVSPVRHIRDGLVENNQSKSVLISTIHSITNNYEKVSYFPSYEILIDELRDYRFYDSDMIHPSSEASQYIWERFKETFFDLETKDILLEWSKIRTAINHKPFQPQSESHQNFLRNTLQRCETLMGKVDIQNEINSLIKLIN